MIYFHVDYSWLSNLTRTLVPFIQRGMSRKNMDSRKIWKWIGEFQCRWLRRCVWWSIVWQCLGSWGHICNTIPDTETWAQSYHNASKCVTCPIVSSRFTTFLVKLRKKRNYKHRGRDFIYWLTDPDLLTNLKIRQDPLKAIKICYQTLYLVTSSDLFLQHKTKHGLFCKTLYSSGWQTGTHSCTHS